MENKWAKSTEYLNSGHPSQKSWSCIRGTHSHSQEVSICGSQEDGLRPAIPIHAAFIQ